MSLYGPTFHVTPIDFCIKFQCNIYIYLLYYVSCMYIYLVLLVATLGRQWA